jgi:thiol-disulfide isomerase/thioredoxin
VSDTGPFPDPPIGSTSPATPAHDAGSPAPPPQPERRRSTIGIWIGLAVLVVLLGVGALALTAPDPQPATASPPGTPGDQTSSTPGATSEVTIDGPALAAPVPDGEPIPDWTAPTLDGDTFAWADRPDGPTVLAVWAPWCPHCQAELPRLSSAIEQHPGVSLVTIATAVGLQPGPTPQEYMDSEDLAFVVALDDEDATLAAGLGIQGFPTTFFVDAEGRVIVSASGELDPASVDQVLTLLEQG